MSLSRMASAGLPVPPGFHVTTAAYRQFVAANNLQARLLAALQDLTINDTATIESASRHIAGLFLAGSIPAEIATAITTAYASLGQDIPVAVRSSATAEDLPGASFAGQQETFLNVHGQIALLEAVQKCWASLWTGRAIAYRLQNHIDQNTVSLAVVVQELVDASAAGILFTANPIDGKRSQLLINAAWGLGEAIVSGAVTPDTITVEKSTGKFLQRHIAEKQVMTVRTGQGTIEQPVPLSIRKKPVLTRLQTKALTRLAIEIEQLYQMPMDIEWAIAGGKLAILQARPITALPAPPLEWLRPDPEAMYARGSLAEHIPAPVTPLFATLGLGIANQATSQMWREFLGEKAAAKLIATGGFYQPLNGYVYGGVRFRAQNLLHILRMSINQIGPVIHYSNERWQAARQELSAVVAQWEPKPVVSLTPSEILTGVREVFGGACRYFTRIQTTLPAASMSEILFSRVYNSLIRRKQDPPAVTFLLGFDTLALRAEKSLYDLALWVRGDPTLTAYISQTPTSGVLVDLGRETAPEGLPAALWAGWQRRLQAYLDEFGHTAYEFDFFNPTPADAPGPILEAVKAFIAGQANNPYERQRQAIENRQQATQAVITRTRWPRKAWFERLLHWAQDTAPMREDSIYEMGKGHPLIRRLLLELGSRLTASGALPQADDIFWLEKAEVEQLADALQNNSLLPDFTSLIPDRKARWRAATHISPPVMIPERSGWARLYHGREASQQGGKTVLKGVGTSSGVVTAPARVLYGSADFASLQPGEVLVAVTTTPAWTPLFAIASAVVTDIGGPLSHSSIIAREYGIPAVMAARGATHIIQSGQLITVDGATGIVTLES